MTKSAILVQARMSSQRCPSKILAPLAGIPLLQRLLQSLERNQSGLEVIVCTSIERSDDAVASFCKQQHFECFRGELNDVAARFIAACKANDLDHFIRLSGDSPWFNVHLVDEVIERYFETKAHLCCNIFPRTFPKGQSIEMLSCKLLETYYPKMNAADREHVTPLFYRDAQQLHIENIQHEPALNQYDLSIDTPAQLKQCQDLFETLERPHWGYSIAEILKLYETHSTL